LKSTDQLVVDVIREGYGDSTTTQLDLEVSENIVKALRTAGWASPDEVRAIVAAAGGRVSVPFDLMLDPPAVLTSWRDPLHDATVLTTSDSLEGDQ
jgi:hypothetical protein